MSSWLNWIKHATFNRRTPGSNPGGDTIYAPIAQLVEHLTFNQGVVGSIPTGGTNVAVEYLVIVR